MAEYIGREEALAFPFANGDYDSKNANSNFILGCESYREYLESIPAADVAPVVHGTWLHHRIGNWIYAECSECKTVHYVKSHYCPNCGTEMRKELENG